MDIVASEMPCLSATRFVDYPSAQLAANLSSADSVTSGRVRGDRWRNHRHGHGTRWIKGYMAWLTGRIRARHQECLAMLQFGRTVWTFDVPRCCDVDASARPGPHPRRAGSEVTPAPPAPPTKDPVREPGMLSVRRGHLLCCDSSCRQHCSAISCPRGLPCRRRQAARPPSRYALRPAPR